MRTNEQTKSRVHMNALNPPIYMWINIICGQNCNTILTAFNTPRVRGPVSYNCANIRNNHEQISDTAHIARRLSSSSLAFAGTVTRAHSPMHHERWSQSAPGNVITVLLVAEQLEVWHSHSLPIAQWRSRDFMTTNVKLSDYRQNELHSRLPS